ncbi:MAG: hypothetical protein WB565_03815 [Acidimicrobiales bacterium]
MSTTDDEFVLEGQAMRLFASLELDDRDILECRTVYLLQVRRPTATQVDALNHWGWTPAEADLNGTLQNTTVFCTVSEDVAESVGVDWEQTPWAVELGPPDDAA